MNNILVIGDCHVDDEQDLSRFKVLSEFIADHRPEYIVIIGDFLTLNCLSAWDKDKRKRMEGKRYSSEIAAGNRALDDMLYGISRYNANQRYHKKKQYRPHIIYIEGNHEDRLSRYLDYDPTFDGHVGIEKDLYLDQRGIKFTPYREYYYINGIGFTHIPHNESTAVSGKYHIHKATDCTINSVVYGHTHKLECANRHSQGMEHLQQILSVGCFFEKHEDYVKGRVTHYWKGVVMLHNYSPNRFDIETYSMHRLGEMYGV